MTRTRGLARWCLLLALAGAPRWALADGPPPSAAPAPEAPEAAPPIAPIFSEAAPLGPPRSAQVAAALRALPSGARIRVQLPTRSVVGAFYGATPGTLLVVEDGPAPTQLQIGLLRGVERSNGRESLARTGLGWGFLIGSAVGVVGTLALGTGGDEDDYFLEVSLVPPMVVGALVGLVIGSQMSRERWEPVARF